MGRFAWSTLSVLIAGIAPALGQAPRRRPPTTRRCAEPPRGCRDRGVHARDRGRQAQGSQSRRRLQQARLRSSTARASPTRRSSDYDEALRADPTFVVVYVNRAQVFRRKRELDRAIADYTDALKVNPAYAFAYNGRGNIFNDKADYDHAIADFDEAIRLDPRMAVAYSNRAWSYRNKTDYDRAIADYGEAIRLDPKSAFYLANRGTVWRMKGDADHAIADLDEALRLDVKAHLRVSRTRPRLCPQGRSRLRHREFHHRDPPQPELTLAYVDRGASYVAKGDHAHAIADAGEAIRLSPNNAAARNLRGFAYKIAGELDRALADSTRRSASLRRRHAPMPIAAMSTASRATSTAPWRTSTRRCASTPPSRPPTPTAG